jgi:hypothetical protein
MAPPIALRTRDYGRTTLKQRHREVVRALGEAFFAHEKGEPSAARLDAFADEVDAFLSPASKTLRFGLMLTLALWRISPLLLARSFTTFPDLPLEERAKIVERMEKSRFVLFALVFAAWKTVLSFVYFEPQAELQRVGYPGPVRKRYLEVAAPGGAQPATNLPDLEARA